MQDSLGFVRCSCPLNPTSTYPTIITEFDFCDRRNENKAFLNCNDALLACGDGLMACWTDGWTCPCPWSLTTEGLVVIGDSRDDGAVCSSSSSGDQTCNLKEGTVHLIGNDVGPMVKYCEHLATQGRKCYNPFYVRDNNGTIVEVVPYPEDERPSPDEDDSNQTATGPTLPRCPNTEETNGNDDWWITQVEGTKCATLFYSSDYRSAPGGGGSVSIYSADIQDTETCDSNYKWKHNFATVYSGNCRSYFVSEGVACLSSCHDKYDCYVSSQEVTLRADSCTSAAGVEAIPNEVDEEETSGTNSSPEYRGTLSSAAATLAMSTFLMLFWQDQM
eukprot:CAMPEP_0197727328 /NCGR_PEP_ID=MMETSP1434-20131217/18860_1 /TAXON_ID=265543 /ORGANISM="Minutocellus polymorphus, Strain CCMP3303" /LENGTH=331 /DNA_ID=CAMNT_0043313477 /DNA_START=216 /DNA_END=1211 /DNA_ORIENTATION=-